MALLQNGMPVPTLSRPCHYFMVVATLRSPITNTPLAGKLSPPRRGLQKGATNSTAWALQVHRERWRHLCEGLQEALVRLQKTWNSR